MKLICIACQRDMILLNRKGTNDDQDVANFYCNLCGEQVKVVSDNEGCIRT